ncbi:uncharacterized protein LOC106666248 isoform X2 [Cimex lectularius]|uniref:PHD-type domain-containing protein n=1 Tax=Cimex lectularius TaxID=79782 RepID=A0A8I6RPL7_CIMLE|nr:uncharacterized protein LOC106666248 isoform X2 [Cimex lectularius]
MESVGKRKRRKTASLDEYVTEEEEEEELVDDPMDKEDSNVQAVTSSSGKPDGGSSSSCEVTSVETKPPVFPTELPKEAVVRLDPQEFISHNVKKLNNVDQSEHYYRRTQYKVLSCVLRKRLHCTICDEHVGCNLGQRANHIQHPLLKVLCCSKCISLYRQKKFELSPDGKDQFCRWCTKPPSESSPLRYCKVCPFAFCEMCIYCNLPLDELATNRNDWLCIVCNMKDLWPSRGVLWALLGQIQFNKSRCIDAKWKGDVSQCCRADQVADDVIIPETEPHNTNTVINEGKSVNCSAVRSVNPMSVVLKPNGCTYFPRARTYRGQHRNVYSHRVPLSHTNYRACAPTKAPAYSLKSLSKKEEFSRPLPASKFETKWLKGRIKSITTVIDTLNANLTRVSNGVPEIDDKFNIKSKLISLTSLLNIGANQINNCTKELDITWTRLQEEKLNKTWIPVNDDTVKEETEFDKLQDQDEQGVVKEKNDEFYLQLYNIPSCSVQLSPLVETVVKEEPRGEFEEPRGEFEEPSIEIVDFTTAL